MTRCPLPPGFEAITNHGAEKIIDQIVAERKQAHRDLLAVVSVFKCSVLAPPRTVAILCLEDGTLYDLTEDAWGRRNYEVSVNSSFKGDELRCVSPPLPGKKLVIVGSEAGTKRLDNY